jgi:tetratricopeptide (TPR) repeat protein
MFKAGIAVLALGATAWGQTPGDAGATKVDKAAAYYHYALAHMYAEMAGAPGSRNEFLNRAIDNYKEAIKADPNTPLLTEELSDLYIQSGRLREAQTDAEEALRQNPNDVPARRLLARVYTKQIGDQQQNRIDESMLKKAIEQYQKIAELAPKDVDSLVMLGRLLKISQNSADAQKVYKQALAVEPENEDALTGLAMVYLDLGQNTEASEILKKLADKSPSQRSLRQLASAYEQMKEFSLAAETLNRALAMNPPDAADLKRAVAQDLIFAKQWDEALKIYQSMAEDEPKDAEPYLRMSEIYRDKKDFAKSRTMSDKAKAIDPSNIEIRYNEVTILEAEGKMPEAVQRLKDIVITTQRKTYSEQERKVRERLLGELGQKARDAGITDVAVDAFRQVGELDPELARGAALETIATYQAGKDYAKYEQEAEAAAKKWPADPVIHFTHALMLADMGKVDPAVAEVKKLLDGKIDRQVYLTLAQVYDKGKKFDDEAKAIDQAEKLSNSKEEKIGVWFARGAMLEKQKKNEASETEFRKILEVDPDNSGALNYLGYMLADRNVKLTEALQMITKALDQEPNNGAYLDSLGWAYFRLGKLPEAEENLRRAVALTPRDATVHDHLGEVLMKESKVREAVTQWETSFKEWNLSSPADADPVESAKVKNKLESAKVRLAKDGSPKKDQQ